MRGRSFKVDRPRVKIVAQKQSERAILPKDTTEVVTWHPLLHSETSSEYIPDEFIKTNVDPTKTETHEIECGKILGERLGVKFYRYHWKMALAHLLLKLDHCDCEGYEEDIKAEKEAGKWEGDDNSDKRIPIVRNDKKGHYPYCAVKQIIDACDFVPDGWAIGLKEDGDYNFLMLEVEDSLKLNSNRLWKYAELWFAMDSVASELQHVPRLVVVDNKNHFSDVSLMKIWYAFLEVGAKRRKPFNSIPPDCAVPLGQQFPPEPEVTEEQLREALNKLNRPSLENLKTGAPTES